MLASICRRVGKIAAGANGTASLVEASASSRVGPYIASGSQQEIVTLILLSVHQCCLDSRSGSVHRCSGTQKEGCLPLA